MSLRDRIIEYLQKQNGPIPRDQLIAAAGKVGHTPKRVYDELRKMEQELAHIGQWKEHTDKVQYICWYDITEDSTAGEVMIKTQECLDRGDDW